MTVTVITQNGWGPLTIASYNGYISTVKLLIQRGADVDISGEVCGTSTYFL